MDANNITCGVTKFVFVGILQNPEVECFLFVFFLVVYMTTWLGNVTIIATVISDHHLHVPMYFFLANLAFLDVSESSVTAPKLLQVLFSKHKTISFPGCLTQMFFFHFIGGTVVFFLMVMAADRYLAITKPLQYSVIMKKNTCLGVTVGAWLGGFVHSIVQVALIIQLPFCGPNILDNFYCDVPQVVKLACTDIYSVELLMVSNNGLVTTGAFIFLLISYSIILYKIRNHVSKGRHKALSTCAAQIAVVSLHFIPCIIIYGRPFKRFTGDKAVSLLYTVITPMLNPIIYTLRNTEMKNAIRRLIGKVLISQQELQLKLGKLPAARLTSEEKNAGSCADDPSPTTEEIQEMELGKSTYKPQHCGHGGGVEARGSFIVHLSTMEHLERAAEKKEEEEEEILLHVLLLSMVLVLVFCLQTEEMGVISGVKIIGFSTGVIAVYNTEVILSIGDTQKGRRITVYDTSKMQKINVRRRPLLQAISNSATYVFVQDNLITCGTSQ
ncbi:hypothetical protein JD844_001731 [Phrynosoma platyrhinos]|uniref:G-protein coupled receptors family 1 profile domain-containing protein n=1 Tax=Phrynosoma platyrhinos TaxID=52577 RepID=A0ABQ7TA93_PHRPL|nr:hypothetical protein JD844_001731 [Phrynosoma platyrhinos]